MKKKLKAYSKYHPLLDLQLEGAMDADDEVDIDVLLRNVDDTYRSAAIPDEVSTFQVSSETEHLISAQSENHRRILRERDDLNLALNALEYGVTLFDKNGVLVTYNSAFLKIFELDGSPDILGKKFGKIVGSSIETELFDDNEFFEEVSADIQKLRYGEKLQCVFTLYNGSSVSVDITKQRDNGWVAVYSSGSGRFQGKARKLDANNRWMFAVESAQQGVWDVDISTGEEFYSHTWLEMRGISDAQYAEHGLSAIEERVHPDDLAQLSLFIESLTMGGAAPHEIEFREKHTNGHWIWILGRGKAIAWDSNGLPTRVIGTDTEITDLKEAQTALSDAEARLSFALEETGQGVWDHSITENTFIFSPKFREMRGYGRDEAFPSSRKAWLERVHPEDRAKLLIKLAERNSDKSKHSVIEYREKHKDGHYIWIESSGQPAAWDVTGNPTRFVGIDVDVTVKRELELQLKENHQALTRALENYPHGMSMFNAEHVLTVANRKFFEMTLLDEHWFPVGSRIEDIINSFAEQGVYGEDLDDIHIAEVIQDAVSGGSRTWSRTRQTDGVTLKFTRTVMDQGGYVLTAEDVTEQLKREQDIAELERELSQNQKMEALGTLASGVAHEINTPVQYVGDNIRFMKDGLGDIVGLLKLCMDALNNSSKIGALEASRNAIAKRTEEIDLDFILEELPQSFDQSLQGIEQVASIVNAIKEFSHPGQGDKIDTDLNAAIEKTMIVSRNQWKYVAEIETDFTDGLPLVNCHPGDINQVILNLIVNAAHAIRDKSEGHLGLIHISTRQNGAFVEVNIADNGCGMAPETLNKIYDPFFTTKDIGEGTGQGLAISFAIVTRKHGGTIECVSEPEKGTTFTISLPIEADKTAIETAA